MARDTDTGDTDTATDTVTDTSTATARAHDPGAAADRGVEPGARPRDPAPGGGRAGGRGRALARGALWVTGTVALVFAVVLVASGIGLWPHLTNPFREQQTDRPHPVLLRSVQDLSRFVAAEGNFEVIVDRQNDRRFVPDLLVNERTLFVAAGTVDAYVDFGQLGRGAIKESADGRTVEITLPAPRLGTPNLNHDRSYVFDQQRGLFNRVVDFFDNDPNKLKVLYQLADERIAAAARDSGLTKQAEDNTRKTLESMLHSLGYSTVNVRFQAA